MKTVKYKGQSFNVPNWAKFIVADNNGEVWVYLTSPYKYADHFWTSSDLKEFVGRLNDSKYKVKEIK